MLALSAKAAALAGAGLHGPPARGTRAHAYWGTFALEGLRDERIGNTTLGQPVASHDPSALPEPGDGPPMSFAQ
jgi:hypothetical protein